MDRAVTEIAAMRPRLRKEVSIEAREQGGETVYLIEDPIAGKFYEIGVREQAFLSRLDGKTSVAEIVAHASAGTRGSGLTEGEANSLVRRLMESRLLATGSEAQASRMRRHAREKSDSDQATQKAKSLFFLRLPLGNPDRFLEQVHRLTQWIPSWFFTLLWVGTVGWGLTVFAENSDRFLEELSGVFEVGSLAIFGAVWLVLKVVHEFCHGIVCKRLGGSVPEAGVSLLLFVTPLAYVDASSSIRFPRRRDRVLVAAAGILGEFFIAALALVAWAQLPPSALGAVLHQVVVISTATTLLFNANPLMRFDGYYILSDSLGITNLYTKGQQVTRFLWKRWFFGIRGVSFPLRETKRSRVALISSYGVASAIWRVVVFVGLFVGACLLFQGAGKILAALVAVAMLIGMVRGVSRYLRRYAALEKASPWKIGLRLAVFAAAISCLAHTIQLTPSVTAPAIVDSGHRGEVRIDCPGFLDEIRIENGDFVEKGDVLVTLRNEEAKAELFALEREWERARLQGDLYLDEGNVAGYQAQQEQVSGLETQVRDLRKYVESLVLRAPLTGKISAPHLEKRTGEFFEKGEIAMQIVASDEIELRVAIPESRIRSLGEITPGRELNLFSTGSGTFLPARLERLQPQAGIELPHPGLARNAGGPLVVRTSAQGDGHELVNPHFLGIATISGSYNLRDGQLLWARFESGESKSIASWVEEWLYRWFARQA